MARRGRGTASTVQAPNFSRLLDILPPNDLVEDHSTPPGTHEKSWSSTQAWKEKGDFNLPPLALDWPGFLAK